MKPQKFQFYLLIILLFLFVGCGGEPDQYTIKVEVENKNTEWNFNLVEDGRDMTPSLKKGTMVLDLPPSKGFFSSGLPHEAKVSLYPTGSKACLKVIVTNKTNMKNWSIRGCGFEYVVLKPKKDLVAFMMQQ